MTRRSVAILTALVLGAALVGCSPGADNKTEPDDIIVIDYEAIVWQPGAVAANKAIVDAWNNANPNVQVNLIEGAWSGMLEKMTTGFEAGKVPDVFHYDAKRIGIFAQQGHILNLDPYISDSQRDDIHEGAWQTLQFEDREGTYGIPFLQETDVVFANRTILEAAGVVLPTMDAPWTWEDYRQVSKQLTVDSNGDGTPEVWGGGVPLENSASRILRLALGNDGFFFSNDGESDEVVFGAAEQLVPEAIHGMIFEDRSVDPGNIGFNTEDMLPNFFAGKTATFLGESWVRDLLNTGAPDGFEWVLLPPLFATSFNQPSDTQALAVTAVSEHPEEAAAFVSFFTNAQNQIQMALGDGLVATSKEALRSAELTTSEQGWDIVSAMGAYLIEAPYQRVLALPEWADRVANPAFDRYFRDQIDLDELRRLLVDEGNRVLERYAG